MKYEAILRHSPIFTVEKMCRALGLKSSAYHQWNRRRQQRAERAEAYRDLMHHVRKVFDDNRRVYGYRKMWRTLNADGLALSSRNARLSPAERELKRTEKLLKEEREKVEILKKSLHIFMQPPR